MFGDRANVTVTNNITQIHELETCESIDPKTAAYEDIKEALASLLFVTKKTNGYIKARKVTDGSKYWLYNGYDKLDGSSLTVTT